MHFVYFLGRFHVLILHLPIGLIFAVVAIEWLARKDKFRYLEPAAPLLWGAAAVTAIVTAVLGYMHFAEGGFQTLSGQYHRIFGTLVAIVAAAGWILRSRFYFTYKSIELYVTAVLLLLVLAAGHTGGSLTHGTHYLVEYAPQYIRSLAGLEPPRPKVRDVASADPYLDVVRPVLLARCSGCHGDEIRRNELSLVTYDAIIKGGKSGPVIKLGDLAGSEMFRRISLPHDSRDFMPAEGKTPLTDAETKILGWWIQSGAPTGTTVAKLSVPGDIQPLLETTLRLGVAPAPPPSPEATAAAAAAEASAAPLVPRPADPELVNRLSSAGFSVRQVALDNPLLIVNTASPGSTISDEAVQTLLAAPTQIVQLDLRRSGIQDASLKTIGHLSKLSQLHLEHNQISDSGVRMLADLKNLEYLNLYDNRGITDASIEAISKLPALRKVYLWNTRVTETAAQELRKKRSRLIVDLGLSAPELSPLNHEGTLTEQNAR